VDAELRDVLEDIGDPVSRDPITKLAEKYSGAFLERVELSNGERLILKWLPPGGDWLTAATNGLGRTGRLWSTGILDCAGSVVDHAVIRVVPRPDGTLVIMRDLSENMWQPGPLLPRAESKRLLAALAKLHAVWQDPPVDGLCPVGARYSMFAPAFHAAYRGRGSHPSAAVIAEGWKLFFDQAPPDVARAVAAIHDDPGLMDRALGETSVGLLHGDAKLANMGFTSTGIVLVDWGELTGFGPAEVDVAWYLVQNAPRIDASREVLVSDYEEAAGHALDRRIFGVACVGSLAQLGFRMAFVASNSDDAAMRDQAEEGLSWWVDRARESLDILRLTG
jgi:hypothetical protein